MTKSIRELIQEYQASGDYSGTFEEVYANAKATDGNPPWAHMQAAPGLAQWAEQSKLSGDKQKAIVVGCGLGDDAEFLAKKGFSVTAFDVSNTAIEICKKRFPDSKVDYQQADLFKLDENWQSHFDFVLENRTIQALPAKLAEQSMGAIANLVAENGKLFILCHGRDNHDPKQGIPWALSRDDLAYFHKLGLHEIHFEDIQNNAVRRFVALYQR